MSIKCIGCGKFIGMKGLDEANFFFEPLNEFGPERLEWTCKKCVDEKVKRHEPATVG